MKRSLLLPALLLSLVSPTLSAQQGWIDVTEQYIINPSYDGDSNRGWEGTDIGHAQPAQAAEHWNKTFDSHQTIGHLPNGRYRLSVSAFYRPGNGSQDLLNQHLQGQDHIPAYIYANQESITVAACYSQWLTHDVDGANYLYNSLIGQSVWYPNSMYSGVAAFNEGLYRNSLEVDVTDHSLTIGIASDTYQPYSWVLFDNWQLEMWGEIIPVTAIEMPTTLSLNLGETQQLDAVLVPANATYRALRWMTTDASVADVDGEGRVTATGKGTAVITATTQQPAEGEPVSATCVVTVSNNPITAESLVINEIMVANIDQFLDPSFNYGSFVELYNPTDQSVNLARCYVSDDADALLKCRLPLTAGILPAHGFLTLWFDHYDWAYSRNQVNFKLDAEGGILYFSDDQGNLIASQSYPAAVSRASYARTADGGDEWRYTSTPTPSATNTGCTFADDQLPAPAVQQNAQFFTGSLKVRVAIPEGATLRYTTDGSTPTLTNGITSPTGTMVVRKAAVYRYRLFQNGMLPSPVVTRSYLTRDRPYTLPVLSIATDPSNLYSTEYGIFAAGPNGRAGNGRDDKCNWNMDWDRPANVELLLADGDSMVLNQEVDMAVCGGWTRANTPHSFKLKAEGQYEGKTFFDYPLFPTKPYNKNRTLQIRNGGNDGSCRIKDPALQEIISRSGLDIDCQAYVPVLHYINGIYNGLLNMREPNNKHYAYANYGLSADDQDQFEISPDSGYVQMTGTKEAFDRWYELSARAADPAAYEEIRTLVDVDEFINYIAIELYLGNWDWPKNNLKAFRPRTGNGRFRFVTFDLDGAFSIGDPFTSFEEKRIFTFDMLRGEQQGEYITDELEIVTIFLNMLDNDTFRRQFIDTYCLVTGSVFEPARCHDIIRELATRVEDYINPWPTANDLISRLNASYQRTNINYLKGYSRMRLGSTSSITAQLSTDTEGAHLMVNGLPVPTDRFQGTLFAPVTVQAVAPAGYTFRGWTSDQSTVIQELFSKGSRWFYYDKGSLDGKSWKDTSYAAQAWQQGYAPLGYFSTDAQNSRGYRTTLDYGNDGDHKRPTYYFRTSVSLTSAPDADDIFTLHYVCDDGFVIYVNGTEAGRYLMPAGTPSYATYASSHAPANPDSGTLTLPTTLFHKGANVIAVELHNNAANSTDVYWDASLQAEVTLEGNSILSTEAEYKLPEAGTIHLVAIFDKNEDTATQHSVCINEVSPSNNTYVSDHWKKSDWIELYNTTSAPVDLTGMYLSDDPAQPKQYAIPALEGIDNVIPPHGYKVIWCDKLEPIHQLHTSFKLTSEGGYVLLTPADGGKPDIMHYPACSSHATIGLYPDGGTATYLMQRPTIGVSNAITTADTRHQQQLPDGIDLIDCDSSVRHVYDGLFDLFGRPVSAPHPGNIYIRGGKKILWHE